MYIWRVHFWTIVTIFSYTTLLFWAYLSHYAGADPGGSHRLPEDGQKWGENIFFINYLPNEDKTTKKIQKTNSHNLLAISITLFQMFDIGRGSALDPAGGAYSVPPDPIPGFKGPISDWIEVCLLLKVRSFLSIALAVMFSHSGKPTGIGITTAHYLKHQLDGKLHEIC